MTVKELTLKDKEIFIELAQHPLQSWEWGEFREKLGQKVIRAGVFERDRLTSAFQFFFHQIPHTSFSVGYFPKSPAPTKEMVEFLKKSGQENKAIFIKFEPNIIMFEAIQHSTLNTFKPAYFKKLGLIPGKPIFTKYTSVIDLALSEEELLARMHPKTRYNIRLAEKHGVVAREDNSAEAFDQYFKLLFETTKRQGFYAHNEKFHHLQWQILQPAGISHLLTATYGAPQSGAESHRSPQQSRGTKWDKNKILAAFLLFVFKDTLYYPYGASTREHKELMAPTLLMWEAIKFGKKMGLKKFDLWGDLEPNPPPNHPYYGFHRFKEGFSPKLVEFVGTYDLVINQPLYKIYNFTDSLRWKILRLKIKLISR